MQEEKHTKLHEGERNPQINFTKNTKTTHKVEHNWSLNAEHNLQITAKHQHIREYEKLDTTYR